MFCESVMAEWLVCMCHNNNDWGRVQTLAIFPYLKCIVSLSNYSVQGSGEPRNEFKLHKTNLYFLCLNYFV